MTVPRRRISMSTLSAGADGTGHCVVTKNHTCRSPAGMWSVRTVMNILGNVLDPIEYSLHGGYILENSYSTRSVHSALGFFVNELGSSF